MVIRGICEMKKEKRILFKFQRLHGPPIIHNGSRAGSHGSRMQCALGEPRPLPSVPPLPDPVPVHCPPLGLRRCEVSMRKTVCRHVGKPLGKPWADPGQTPSISGQTPPVGAHGRPRKTWQAWQKLHRVIPSNLPIYNSKRGGGSQKPPFGGGGGSDLDL